MVTGKKRIFKPIQKFYLSSFLKNQTYFTPILIVFLQAQTLSFTQIFWVFTLGNIVKLILEIPTGIFADFFGKKKSTLIAKSMIFVSFMTYGFADTFWLFIIAQSFYEIGNSFRSGSETAFIYDYLAQNKDTPDYTEVKGKQKFWARVGESIATASGGVIAGTLGYSWVFFLAAIPAFINIINIWSWPKIKERTDDSLKIKPALKHTRHSICQLCKNRNLLLIVINITLFVGVLGAMDKFIQPYMEQIGIPIEYFGFIYAASLAVTAIAVRYSYLVEERFGNRKTINTLTLLAVIPAAMVGIGFRSYMGVALFFLILIIENIRSPIANKAFHSLISSEERATLGSILSLFKSLGKIIILPLAGYLAEMFSLYTAVLVLAGILLINGLFFYFRKTEEKTSAKS